MSNPFVGEIRMFGGNFPPAGWEFCDGQLLPISENDVLFQLIGTTYGGDGQNTFALPDLRGRVPLHMGTSSENVTYQIGEMAGVESVTLTTAQMPNHSHQLLASSNAVSPAYTASNGVLGKTTGTNLYALAGSPTAMMANRVSSAGGSQPHTNMAPYLGINYIISLYGIFPTQ
ncbi:MAG: phage tail protein [Massilia sp.]